MTVRPHFGHSCPPQLIIYASLIRYTPRALPVLASTGRAAAAATQVSFLADGGTGYWRLALVDACALSVLVVNFCPKIYVLSVASFVPLLPRQL